jgi:5-oxoprolinase (ATP-hydrolysing)
VEPDRWRLWIDTGGTFTDCLAEDPAGSLHRAKVLSSSALRARIARVIEPNAVQIDSHWGLPSGFFAGASFRVLDRPPQAVEVRGFDPDRRIVELAHEVEEIGPDLRCELSAPVEAPVLAAHVVTRTPLTSPLPSMAVRLASTKGTNALLERKGTATALFITRGFGDLLTIGTQQRPELFALEIVKPPPLYTEVVEVAERLAADGTVLEPLDMTAVRSRAEELVARGVRCAAVALMNSWCNPAHERALADVLQAAGFRHVSRSSALAPLIRLLPRAQTAVVDAYLAPIIGDYLGSVEAAVTEGTLHVMTSAGGLVAVEGVRPKDTLLSGPAGGVVGAAAAGLASGCARVISFDMGGTSTDVARWDGDFEYLFEHRVGDAHLMAPALAVETVAAGGGSICRFDGHGLRVGPESAGAAPGPACYGAGGPLTLTDLNLLLGRIETDQFQIPVDRAAAEAALDNVSTELRAATGEEVAAEALADGFLSIANERMAAAIRKISVRRGYDATRYPLLAFGGAGPQHACAVASLLAMDTALVPLDASLLSAAGVGAAVVERFAQLQLLQTVDEVGAEGVAALFARLDEEACDAVKVEGVEPARIRVRRRIAHLRLDGQDSTLEVGWHDGVDLGARFADRYREVYGYPPPERKVEIESLRTVASSVPPATQSARPGFERVHVDPAGTRRAFFAGRWWDAELYLRERLREGAVLDGPALVAEPHSVTVVEPGWRLEVDGSLALRMTRRRPDGSGEARRTSEAVELELFSNRFVAIASEMGAMLQRCALSTNVKERLDFSCAVLDAGGRLVVNAPHIPVHLGALGLCVRRLLEEVVFAPDDTVVTNHPAYGGSHLPDVTAVTPVFCGERLLGFVANRAHHAEIGGSRPGSVPPDARCLAEEGVVIAPTHLVRRGEARWQAMRAILAEAPYPSRAIEDNLADLSAAVAANRMGVESLSRLVLDHGFDAVAGHMEALALRAARLVGDALERLQDGSYEAREHLDDGAPLVVCLRVAGRRAEVDFTGSAGVHPGNLNATPAVVRAAVLYVLRLLVAEPLPLNEGLMEAVDLVIPRGMLDPDFPADPMTSPAVVGGNVETSQRLVDTLLKALGLAACSQGTMNNVIFGDAGFGYYETVAGGAGAGPAFAGADAVHTHMTNTRATDPELLEHRFPVRLERAAVRARSGGAGRHPGGDGVIRELEFLRPVSLSLLSQHRAEGPYGMAGGSAGRTGRQRLVRVSGEVLELAGIDSCEVEAGDRLILETPGGGGWGAPDSES